MAYATVQDFRRRMYREITLPESGLVVRIRRIMLHEWIGIGELPLPGLPEREQSFSPEEQLLRTIQLLRYSDRAIALGAVEPPMTDARDEERNPQYCADKLHVDELYQMSIVDYSFLSESILNFSGLAPEVAAKVEAFRPDPLSQAGGDPCGEISPTPEHDPCPVAGGFSVDVADCPD